MSFDSWNKTFPYINLPYAFSSEKTLCPFLSSGPFGIALWFVNACASLESWLHFSHQSLCRVSTWIIGVCLASGGLRNWKVWFKCQTATWKASGDAEPGLWSDWGNAHAKLNRKVTKEQRDVPRWTCGMHNMTSSFSIKKSGSEGDRKSQPCEENEGRISYLGQWCLREAKDW